MAPKEKRKKKAGGESEANGEHAVSVDVEWWCRLFKVLKAPDQVQEGGEKNERTT